MAFKNKVSVSAEIEEDHLEWLENVTVKFDLPDTDKALRIILDFAMQDNDQNEIFAAENMRCLHCS
ncbi:MAG: hypothetical protein ACJ0A3_04290 [Dehalococcoidia bacterium]|jgi:hypothetical protein